MNYQSEYHYTYQWMFAHRVYIYIYMYLVWFTSALVFYSMGSKFGTFFMHDPGCRRKEYDCSSYISLFGLASCDKLVVYLSALHMLIAIEDLTRWAGLYRVNCCVLHCLKQLWFSCSVAMFDTASVCCSCRTTWTTCYYDSCTDDI